MIAASPYWPPRPEEIRLTRHALQRLTERLLANTSWEQAKARIESAIRRGEFHFAEELPGQREDHHEVHPGNLGYLVVDLGVRRACFALVYTGGRFIATTCVVRRIPVAEQVRGNISHNGRGG